MHHNDNEFDQFFHDRLRNHSSPVRGDLWRHIHTGIDTPARRPHFLRHWRYIGAAATTVTVALAAHLIFTPSHRPNPLHPSVPSVNHYSRISHSAASRPDTATLNQTLTPIRQLVPAPGNLASTPGNSAHPPIPNSNFPDLHRQIQKTKKHNTSPPRMTPSATDLASYRGKSSANDPGKSTANDPARTPASTAETSLHHHQPVTLPAIARTSALPAITIRPSFPRIRHSDPDTDLSARHSIKIAYISLYGSVDFPANHYYTWSGTVGGAVTVQFGRQWSFTAGIEYGKVNVPTQVVPPIGYMDTLHGFYFSNYEVPVLIGYTMMLGKFALTVNGGAIINIHSHQSNSPGNLVTSASSTWVFNWPNRDDFGAYLGADIYRPLSHSLRLFAQPYARFSLSDYRMFIPVQRFFYGANAGIRYQL
jgi:hypothetical protein